VLDELEQGGWRSMVVREIVLLLACQQAFRARIRLQAM